MELNLKNAGVMKKNKEKIKVSTIVLGLLAIGLSIAIALLITMPDLLTQIMMVKWEIFKGSIIGLSALPVFLFVTIKGGTNWAKKWWTWASIGVVLLALLALVTLQGNIGSNANQMNMDMPQDMGIQGKMMIP